MENLLIDSPLYLTPGGRGGCKKPIFSEKTVKNHFWRGLANFEGNGASDEQNEYSSGASNTRNIWCVVWRSV